MFSFFTVLEAKKRVEFFSETLPCLAKVCQAFPPLCEDVTTLLAQIGRVCLSQINSLSNRPETGKGYKKNRKGASLFIIEKLFSIVPHKHRSFGCSLAVRCSL